VVEHLLGDVEQGLDGGVVGATRRKEDALRLDRVSRLGMRQKEVTGGRDGEEDTNDPKQHVPSTRPSVGPARAPSPLDGVSKHGYRQQGSFPSVAPLPRA